MEPGVLKLLADEADGLGVIASAVQDALVRPQDMKFNRRCRSFGLEVNRFQWERAGKKAPFFRSRAILAFSDVLGVQTHAVPMGIDAVLALLDIRFAPDAEPPGGSVVLLFALGAEIRLQVECLDVTLMDDGRAWPTTRRPDHETAP